MEDQMQTEQSTPLDVLRVRREQLGRSLADAIAARTQAQTATADAVAATGSPPSDWPSLSAKLDSDVHSLRLGADRLDVDVRAELGRVNLSVAKLGQRRQTLVIARDQRYAERTELFVEASRNAVKQEPIPSTFASALASLEEWLADVVSQLDTLDAELTVASAPALRYERDQMAARQRADIVRANAA